jgi:hypothetical protein
MRWHVAALFDLRIFQPHPVNRIAGQSYRPFWRMVRFDFAIMLFAEPYLLFACRDWIQSLVEPISPDKSIS